MTTTAAPAKQTHREVFIRFHSTVEGEMLVPDTLHARLIEEAQGSNMTDVITRVLAAEYRLPFQSSGRAGRSPDPTKRNVKIRLPVSIHQAVAAATGAVYPPRSIPDEIRRVLCAHYGLPFAR